MYPKPEQPPTGLGSIQQNMNDTLSNCPTPKQLVSMNTSTSEGSLPYPDQCLNIITPLGAVSGTLAAVLVATLVGWTVTCVVWRKESTKWKFLK